MTLASPRRALIVMFTALLLVTLGAATATSAFAATTYTLKSMAATVTGSSVAVSASITSSVSTTMSRFGICVRDSAGGNLDYPANVNVLVSPTRTASYSSTKTFAPGTYTYFVCINANNTWTNLASKTFTVSPAPTGGPAAGKALTFSDDFNSLSVGSPGSTWSYKTSAYAYGDHNPADSKLDWTTPSAMTTSNGVVTMTATKRADGYWNTGLLTTENSYGVGGNGVRIQPGDFYVTRTRMPDTANSSGAWPAMWAWTSDFTRGGEIDPYEYHSDNPNLLEIGTSQCQCGTYYTNANLVAPGQWVWVGVQVSDTNNVFYVGDTLDDMQPVWSDNTGLKGARPYPMVNLSVSNGNYHPAPSGTTPIIFQVDTVRIYH